MLPFFASTCYLDIIRQQLERNSGVKGYKSLLAKAAGFHTSYLSHVLSERAHISPEQGIAMCDFWEFNTIHTEYFLALLNKDRAGSDRLRKKFETDIERVRSEAADSFTVMAPKEITQVPLRPDQVLFYLSNWHCVAIHMSLRIHGLRTIPALMERFALTEQTVKSALDRMAEMMLVKDNGGEWIFTNFADVGDSAGGYPKVFHHTMRQRANQAMDFKNAKDIFSTWVVASSRPEIESMKASFEEIIKSKLKGSLEHPEEELFALNLDFFTL